MTDPARARASTPAAWLLPAPRIDLPSDIDSSNPFIWDRVDGVLRLFVITSWGGVPVQSSGADFDRLRRDGEVRFTRHPGHGVWMESIVKDEAGRWYGYYHHERPADDCNRPDRQLPRIGAMRSLDHGATWEDLGVVIDAPPNSAACASTNRFVLGGVGDVSAMLDANGQDLYLYFSQYSGGVDRQGVAVARLAWADRDNPAGKVTIFNNGAWLPVATSSDAGGTVNIFPAGTPIHRATKPFHDGISDADVFWGPSIHWNTYLDQYVMLLSRAANENFGTEGIYISYSRSLSNPLAWSAPAKLMDGGQWYPQVVGVEQGIGTDKLAGKSARFFLLGRSNRMIVFSR